MSYFEYSYANVGQSLKRGKRVIVFDSESTKNKVLLIHVTNVKKLPSTARYGFKVKKMLNE